MGDYTAVQFLPEGRLGDLFDQLKSAGYSIVAPTVVDGAVLYRETDSIATLPAGIVDEQQPGHYRLHVDGTKQRFGWSSGVQGIKSTLFPSEQLLWQSQREEDGTLHFRAIEEATTPTALFGVRACDLAAIALMDRHFLRAGEEDPWYQQRRVNLLLVAVSCSRAAENCFCASTGSGPEPQQGYDLRLDELQDGYLVHADSEHGEAIVRPLQLEQASESQQEQVSAQLQAVAEQQQKALAVRDFRPHLAGAEASSIWQQIAERCLGCGNCTAVCPTCFCHREEEVASLDLQQSVHQRVWDSCFSDEHSQLHGVPVRTGRRERYRQWMTHKLAGWHDQFGESGCVGCGRCITWCPAGIDFVAEAGRFVGDDHAS